MNPTSFQNINRVKNQTAKSSKSSCIYFCAKRKDSFEKQDNKIVIPHLKNYCKEGIYNQLKKLINSLVNLQKAKDNKKDFLECGMSKEKADVLYELSKIGTSDYTLFCVNVEDFDKRQISIIKK